MAGEGLNLEAAGLTVSKKKKRREAWPGPDSHSVIKPIKRIYWVEKKRGVEGSTCQHKDFPPCVYAICGIKPISHISTRNNGPLNQALTV